MKLPLSIALITKNEASNIRRCLDSVQWAEDVIVVDSGSTDATCEMARALGARVINEKWRGFGPQKAFAAKQARYDWVLSLDADEVVSQELANEIGEKFARLDSKTAYRFPRKSFFLGRWILHGGWYPDRQTRLFNRQYSMWNDAGIHEQVEAASFESFEAPLHHFVFTDISHQIETNNRYSSLLAEKDFAAGKRFSLFRLLTKGQVKFCETYILKRGFMDGLPGFIIAVNAAISIFLRTAKIWELEKLSKDKK